MQIDVFFNTPINFFAAFEGRNTWTNGSWVSWWTNASIADYQKTKKCFESFFDGLSVGPLLINGVNISVR
jgi:hypothetical protein